MAAAELAGPVRRMLEHHHALLHQWPGDADPVEIRLSFEIDAETEGGGDGSLALEDWLDGLRVMEGGEESVSLPQRCARWEFYPKSIMERGKITRLSSLLAGWVKHLAGCAQGISLTSYLVAPDGIAELRPIEREKAYHWLAVVVGWYLRGLRRPLPVAAKSALAHQAALFRGSPKDSPEGRLQKALAAARKAYQGDGYQSSGEVGFSPYLQRSYPDFDALEGAGDNHFGRLSEALYAPLLQVLEEAR